MTSRKQKLLLWVTLTGLSVLSLGVMLYTDKMVQAEMSTMKPVLAKQMLLGKKVVETQQQRRGIASLATMAPVPSSSH